MALINIADRRVFAAQLRRRLEWAADWWGIASRDDKLPSGEPGIIGAQLSSLETPNTIVLQWSGRFHGALYWAHTIAESRHAVFRTPIHLVAIFFSLEARQTLWKLSIQSQKYRDDVKIGVT